MKPKYKRFFILLSIILVLGISLTLAMFALENNMMYFMSPRDFLNLNLQSSKSKKWRLGGLVKEGSLQSLSEPMAISFIVTDFDHDIIVHYKGVLPDLFREGQGVIAIGIYEGNNKFLAEQILAKHDEKYMPREIADSLKKADHWKGNL